MRKVLVAAFETEAQTDEAVTDLKGAGIPSTAIRRYAADEEQLPDAETIRSEQASTPQLAGGGRTVVAVTIDHPESGQVRQILAAHRPARLHDTGTAPEAAVGENVATPARQSYPADQAIAGQQPERTVVRHRPGTHKE